MRNPARESDVYEPTWLDRRGLAHGALVEWIHPDDWPALEAVVLYLAKPFTPDQLRHEVHRTLLLAGS